MRLPQFAVVTITLSVATVCSAGVAPQRAGDRDGGAARASTLGSPAELVVGTVYATSGTTVELPVNIRRNGVPVSHLDFTLAVPEGVGFERCRVNPDIEREASSYRVSPPECGPQVPCTTVEARIRSFRDFSVLQDGVVVFTCTVMVPATPADASYEIEAFDGSAIDPEGNSVPFLARNGHVLVGGAPTLTPTATVPTATPSATPTGPQPATPTLTPILLLDECPGDCNRDDVVAVSDLIRGARALLELAALDECPQADFFQDGIVSVDEVVLAVRAARRQGCDDIPIASGLPPVIELSVSQGGVLEGFLESNGQDVAALQLDLQVPFPVRGVQCDVDEEIAREASMFAELSRDDEGNAGDSIQVRALLISFANQSSIPDGSRLFSCTLDVDPSAPSGFYPVLGTNALAAGPRGSRIPVFVSPGGFSLGGVATPTPSPPLTLSPFPTLTRTRTVPPTATPTPCRGDCNSNGVVTISELIRAVRIALGELPALVCPITDANADGRVAVNELVLAVRSALEGCP